MNVLSLPDGYTLVRSIDLMREKKLSVFINVIAVVIAVAMVALGFVFLPVRGLLDINMLANAGIVLVGIIIYMVLHELIHGLFMKLFVPKAKIKYGFTGVYAYAGSPHTYFGRASYVVIALAPVVILGIVLAACNVVLFPAYFWGIYFIQVVNISGAAGDFYLTHLMFVKMPKDVLVCDCGVSMTMYSSEGKTGVISSAEKPEIKKITLDSIPPDDADNTAEVDNTANVDNTAEVDNTADVDNTQANEAETNDK